MAEATNDARINGDGSIAGGVYRDIVINGSGSVTGDIECKKLTLNGSGRCASAVKAGSVVVNGAGTFDGPVQVSDMRVNGTADIHAGLGVSALRVTGTLGVDGGMASHDVELRGELRVGGDLSADRLAGEGRFVVAGLLNADSIEIKLHGRSSANEIGGERIRVDVPTGFTSLLSMFGERKLVADSIEADEVWLSNTTAKVVRGARVTLGEGCDVELVEYTESLERLAGARVGEARQVTSGE